MKALTKSDIPKLCIGDFFIMTICTTIYVVKLTGIESEIHPTLGRWVRFNFNVFHNGMDTTYIPMSIADSLTLRNPSYCLSETEMYVSDIRKLYKLGKETVKQLTL